MLMKKIITLITLIAGIGILVANELPEGKPDPKPEDNPLKDYVLAGVSGSEDFRIIIYHRDNLEKRIIVDSSRPSENPEFRVIRINRVPDKVLSTTVTLALNGDIGTVGFESEIFFKRQQPSDPVSGPPRRPKIHHAGQPHKVKPHAGSNR